MTRQHDLEPLYNGTHKCDLGVAYDAFIVANDLITVAVGKPVITKLLWITITSKKRVDILNLNLALIHSVHYWVSFLHFIHVMLRRAHVNALWFLLTYTLIGGSTSLCFICMERYVAVIHPTHYPLLTKYRCRELLASVAWLLSVTPSLLCFTHPGDGTFSCGMVTILSASVMSVMVFVMGGCTIAVAKMLKQLSPGKAKLQPSKRRAHRTVCGTSILAVSCYAPVATILQLPVSHTVQECFVVPVCIMLLSFASVIHPLFYLNMQRNFLFCFKNKQIKLLRN